MSGNRKYSSIFSRGPLGKQTGSDDETFPATVRVPGAKRETGGSRFRRRGGVGASGGRPVVRFLVRTITNPRTILIGVLIFVATPAVFFFGRASQRLEDSRRLTEPQRLAVDLDVPDEQSRPGEPPVLPPEVFREVPPVECTPSSLLEKVVDPSDYEYGCDEIEVR